MKYLALLITLVLGIPNASSYQNNNNDWRLELDREGVSVYLKKIEGFEIHGIKATIDIRATKKKLVSIINDVENYKSWVADCNHSALIVTENPSESVSHLKFDSPWPIQDRDVFFHRVLSESNDNQFSLTFTASSDYLIEESCCVRIKRAIGKFSIIEKKENLSQVIYEFVSDPGGNLPNWLVSYILTDSPYTTLSNLRELAENQVELSAN
ncbi:MAG: hypothetical protein KDE30_13165 [Novosphingobium sp.]|nr:hypothetical protein [Novosphingobium sp.]